MSYIGKNPKVDSVKLEGSEAAASGTAEGQLYYNTGTGSISKGLKVFKNNQFVAIDKQLGDADTFHLLKAADISTAEWNAARNSTSTSFLNQNAVPFETTTASGAAGTFSNSSTGDALLTDESADLVFAYKSSGTSDDAQEYFGIPLSIPKAFRGGNVVLSFEYRTGFGTGTTATLDGDFEVSVLDKSSGNGGQTTSTNSTTDITAGSAITVASKTGLAVGQRIRLEAGSQSTIGNPDATVVEAYITEVSSTANEIKISENWDTPHASGAVVVSGWLTDVVPGQLLAADSQTDKQGKKFSIQFKTEDDTSDIVLFFQNKNTSSTISRHLFVDNILLSANKFLQASGKGKSEGYYTTTFSGFWQATGTTFLFNTTNLASGGNTPPLASSRLISISDVSSKTRITAKQDIVLDVTVTNNNGASNATEIFNSDDQSISMFFSTSAHWGNVSASVSLKKDDYVYLKAGSNNSNEGGLNLTATPETSDVIVLESQDEIFTDWIPYTPSFTGFGTPSNVSFFYKRNGDSIDIRGSFASGTTSTDIAQVGLPSGLSLDFGKLNPTEARDQYGTIFLMGGTAAYYSNVSGGMGLVSLDYSFPNSICFSVLNVNQTQTQIMTGGGLTGTGNTQMVFAKNIPIAGYNSNFNPLLSLPLVDTGNQFESFLGYDVSGASTKSHRGKLDNITTNTINTLGTIDNSSTMGWSFQANQRVKCYFAFGMASGTGVAGICGVKFSDDPSTVADNALTSSHFDGLRVTGVQDTDGGGFQATASGNFIMEAGEFLQFGQEGSSFQNSNKAVVSLIVEKADDRKQLAHIIKPAVAIIQDRKSAGTNGGTSGTTGSFHDRTLNTFKGETWFVTPGTGTTGVGGTCASFTLQAGTYKVHAISHFMNTNGTTLKLLDSTNTVTLGLSGPYYVSGGGGATGDPEINCTFTLTSSALIKLQYRPGNVNSTNDLGQSNSYGVDEIYSTVVVEKLK